MPSQNSVSTSTLKFERNLLRKLFQIGKHNSLIARVPGFPTAFNYKTHTIAKDERRGRFTGGPDGTYRTVRDDFSHIRRLLNTKKYQPSLSENGSYESWSKVNGVGSSKEVEERDRWAVKARPRFARAQYWFLCILIANTGIRPSEVVKLRHNDLGLFKSPSEDELYTRVMIRREVSKVRKFRDVIASDFHKTYERYLDYCREIRFRFGKDIQPSDYIFPKTGNYNSHIDRLNNLIRPNLIRIGLHKKASKSHPDVDVYYSAYSFRSWYITQRLENGLNIYTLAKNCGTSIKTIASTYDYSENWAFRHEMTSHLKAKWREQSDGASKYALSDHITAWK
jgi:integrase